MGDVIGLAYDEIIVNFREWGVEIGRKFGLTVYLILQARFLFYMHKAE